MNPETALIILETALLTSEEPVPLSDLARILGEEIEPVHELIASLAKRWEGRGLDLVEVAGGWRFRSRPEMKKYLDRLNARKPLRYSRATLETLAIIAYRQPVTRGDIEEIRGVSVSSQILKTLEARSWIEIVGHREVPGRPALYATTVQFLNDLNLSSLEQLPPLKELDSIMG